MELKKGYKQTDLGVIPEDWQVKTMAETGENIIGLTYSPKDVKEYGHLVLRASNIQNNKLAFENNVFVEMELPKRVIVKENDILICVRNGSKQLIGKCALINKATEGCAFGAFMSVYRTIYAKYIFHQFQSNVIQKQIDEVMGATINQLTNKNLASFKIPFPKKEAEQTAIANALSNIDELITQTEKLIEKKKAIKQGVMQELLKPKEGWVSKKFNNIFEKHTSKNFQINSSQYKDSGVYPVIDQGKRKIVAFSDDGTKVFDCPKKGIIVFGDHTRIFKYVNFDFIIGADGTQLLATREGYDTILLYYILFNKEIPNTGYNRHFKFLKEMIFEMPASLEDQKAISKVLIDIDSELSSLETKLKKLKLQKQGMMQALLTGKIRLI